MDTKLHNKQLEYLIKITEQRIVEQFSLPADQVNQNELQNLLNTSSKLQTQLMKVRDEIY